MISLDNEFWENPLTSVEFVEWNSTVFLTITENEKIITEIKANFSLAKDFIDYIKKGRGRGGAISHF